MPNLLVVGCGTTIHAAHILGWTETSIDINGATAPTIVGDITRHDCPLKTNAIYRNHFNGVFFENIPFNVLAGPVNQAIAMGTINRVLRTGGFVRIKTGQGGQTQVQKIKRLFFAWGYGNLNVHPNDNQLIARLDLEAEAEQGFDFTFSKRVGARQLSAEAP